MAFKTLPSLDCESVIALGGRDKKTNKANPTSIEGFYLGSKVVQGKKGPSLLHAFSTAKGNIGVWGKTNLNSQLETIVPENGNATMVRASFVGMVETPRGDMYKYKVEVDRDSTLEVGDLSTASNVEPDSTDGDDNTSTSSFEDSADDSSDTSSDDDVPLDETPPARAVAPKSTPAGVSAARQAEIQALLKKGNRSKSA